MKLMSTGLKFLDKNRKKLELMSTGLKFLDKNIEKVGELSMGLKKVSTGLLSAISESLVAQGFAERVYI